MKYDIDPSPPVHKDSDVPKQPVTKPPNAQPPATKKKPTKEPRTKWGEYVQPEDTHGPMVIGAMPSGGVTLREGDTTQRNDLKVPKGKVTRGEYRKMMDALGVGGRGESNAADTANQVPLPQKQNQILPVQADTKETKSRPKAAEDKPAVGKASAAVLQQTPKKGDAPVPRPGSKGGAKGKHQQSEAPSVLKPQAVAPIPTNMHSPTKGDYGITKRERKIPRSPRQRPAPLPPPLYPAIQGHGNQPDPRGGYSSPRTEVVQNTIIMADVDGM